MKTGSHRFMMCLFLAVGAVGFLMAPGSAAMKMTPYLQAVTTDSIYILVESDTTNPVTVEYGPTTSYGSKATTESTEATDASPATYIHNVKLTGLKPNTMYHYRASQDGVQSLDYAYVTAVEAGTNFRFALMGDCRANALGHDEVSLRLKEANPRFSLYGGDLCDKPAYNVWKAIFFRQNELALIATVPFFNAPGNHEGWSTNTKAFTQAPESPSGTQEFYSFDYGDVHFVALNTEVSYVAGSPQYEFVAKDLASTKKAWKIVYSHKPAYCARADQPGEDQNLIKMATGLFEPNQVDLVLSGHHHFYQHNLVNGIHYVVIGSSAAGLYDPATAPYTLKSVKDFSHAIVDITPTTLHMSVRNNNGTVLDTIGLSKTGKS